ncbi:glycosyltransferase family 9 protein [Escherichia coli]
MQGGNVVESNLSVLTPLGLDSLVKQTTMSYPPASWKRMRRELDHAGVRQNYLVIQPTARQIFKCWDGQFSAVIDALHARGYEVVVTFQAQIKTIWPASMKLRRDCSATSNGARWKGEPPELVR